MPGINQFLPFATALGANVLNPTDYAALAQLAQGFQSGIASSKNVNTPLRQATFVAAAIAQIIANNGVNANDDGNLNTFVANFINAIYANPALTGNPTAPTQSVGDASTKLANTQFVTNQINAAFANNVSFANNGYQKLPSGLIVQWGRYTTQINSEQIVTINTPVAFPNACIHAMACALWNDWGNDMTILVQGSTKTSVSVAANYTTVGGQTMGGFYWLAIGY